MELHQIKYLLAVVREGNFSKAAAACNVSQPSITRGIRKLEQEFGAPLLDRRSGGVFLTQLGREVLPRLEAAFGAIETVLAEAEGLHQHNMQRLRVGLMCTIGPRNLLDLVQAIQTRVPDLDLRIEEARAQEIIDRLIADEVDVAIACLPAFPEEVAARPLFKERYVVAFAPGHRFEALERVPFQELNGERYLERLHCEFDNYYAAHFGEQPFDLDIRFSSEREDWIQAMIAANLGIAIMPEFLPRAPGILTRPIVEPDMIREIALVNVRGRPHTQAVAAFMRVAASIKWGLYDLTPA